MADLYGKTTTFKSTNIVTADQMVLKARGGTAEEEFLVQNVSVQYNQPINVGMVKDIDAAFKTLHEKLKAAGVEKVRAELQKQVDEHIKAMQ